MTGGGSSAWRSDPYGRHELRYWDGRAWTGHVSDLGVPAEDPVFPVAPRRGGSLAPRRRPRRAKPGAFAQVWAVGGFLTVVGLASVSAWDEADPTTVTAGQAAAHAAASSTRPGPIAQGPATVAAAVAPPPAIAPSSTAAPPPRATTGRPSPTGSPTQGTVGGESSAGPTPFPVFGTCEQLTAVYPHGIARPGAVDRTTAGAAVTTFALDATLYFLNLTLDDDLDGVVCERP